MEGVKIEEESRDGVELLRLTGYLDTETAPAFEKRVQALEKQGRWSLVVDLGGVDYISSAGWSVFISSIKAIRAQGGDLKLSHMNSDLREVYELLEFGNILQAFDTAEEAIKSFVKKKE
jgi:anti-sigma B factor antagonist